MSSCWRQIRRTSLPILPKPGKIAHCLVRETHKDCLQMTFSGEGNWPMWTEWTPIQGTTTILEPSSIIWYTNFPINYLKGLRRLTIDSNADLALGFWPWGAKNNHQSNMSLLHVDKHNCLCPSAYNTTQTLILFRVNLYILRAQKLKDVANSSDRLTTQLQIRMTDETEKPKTWVCHPCSQYH
jgi:hypothetical protein